MSKVTLNKTWETETLDLPEQLEFELAEHGKHAIEQVRKYMKRNGNIQKIGLYAYQVFADTPSELESAYGELRIGYESVIVYEHGLYYEVQCKYDSGNQAEYEFNI